MKKSLLLSCLILSGCIPVTALAPTEKFGLREWRPPEYPQLPFIYVLTEDTDNDVAQAITSTLTQEEIKQYASGEKQVAGTDELQIRYYSGLSPVRKQVFDVRMQKMKGTRQYLRSLGGGLVGGGRQPSYNYGPSQGDNSVYSPDECIGAVVNGQCHGSVLPKAGYHETCYGEMIGGRCTGPQF